MLYSWVAFYCLEMEYGCHSLNGISKPVVSSLCNRNSRWWLSLSGFFAKVNQLYHFFLSVPVPQPLSWHHHPLRPKNSNHHLLFPHSSYQIVHSSPVFFFLFFSAVAQSFIALWLTESKYWWLVTALNGWRSLLLVSCHSPLIPPVIYVGGVQVTFPKLVF